MNFKKRVNGSWTDIPHYIHNTSTDTLTTLPADIYANDTTATVGLKGQMEQSSQPSPQTPIQPSECGERTANLYNIDAKNTDNGYINGTQLNKDGTTESWSVCEVTEYIELQPSTTYRLSKFGSFNAIAYCIYDVNKQYISGENYSGQSVKDIVMPSNGKYLRFSHYKMQTNTMLNEGSTTLPYEPYGYKIPILSANTTTNIYLGEVETTRQIKQLVLTGEEAFVYASQDDNRYVCSLTDSALNMSNAIGICSHLVWKINYDTSDYNRLVRYSNTMFFMSLANNLLDEISVNGFKTYLQQQYAAGTPVCVWYVLATPQTAVVNEPLRKIGDYADEVSGITIPTIAGANTLSIGTTLQPSEVSVNYHGWHPVSAVHERENGQWD